MGDVHLIHGFIVPERVVEEEVVVEEQAEGVQGGGESGHKLGKMRDRNDEGWRCHLVTLHWDVLLVHVH